MQAHAADSRKKGPETSRQKRQSHDVPGRR
jgi:hypothetical protein